MAQSVACDGEIQTLRGYETGTSWGWRALAGIRDVSGPTPTMCPRHSIAATDSESSCKLALSVARAGAKPTTSFAREGQPVQEFQRCRCHGDVACHSESGRTGTRLHCPLMGALGATLEFHCLGTASAG
jgi:hypothetical protein